MNILYFAPHPLGPVNSGARLRDYHLARYLADRSSLTFVEMCDCRNKKDIVTDSSCFARILSLNKGRTYSLPRILRGLLGPTPLTVLNCWSINSASQLTELLRDVRFDTIQIEGVHLTEHLPFIDQAQGNPAVVVDWHNIESELMWRYAETVVNYFKKAVAKRTAKLLEQAENKLLERCDTHTVPSERERQKLLERKPSANIHVVPNGVDVNRYSLMGMSEARGRESYEDVKPTIVFVGSMDYHANIDAVAWFSSTAWPEIARLFPHLQFTIVGRDPTSEVRALAADRIQVTGTVDDVRGFYARALAMVVPLRSGSGTRLKILEAMAAGVPIVSTRLGAEGIDAVHNVHLLLADSASEIVAAVGELVASRVTRMRLATAASKLVARYDWGAIGEQVYRVHCNLVEAKQPTLVGRVGET